MGPFSEYVCRCVHEEGTQSAAAKRLGLSVSSLSLYFRGLGSDKRPKPTVGRRTVERILERDGRGIGDLYP